MLHARKHVQFFRLRGSDTIVIERQLTFVGSLYTYKDGFDFFIISPAYKLNVQIGP